MSSETAQSVQELYRTASDVRGSWHGDAERATGYFRRYVDFVLRAAAVAGRASGGAGDTAMPRLLDIGCGAGWSAFSFAREGFETTGVDLNARAFEPPPTPGLTLQEASGMDLPFEKDAFDVVTMYQTLEHIPDPARALEEMIRVCKPGGIVCVVGPNLLGAVLPLKAAVNALRNRPARTIFFRSPSMPRHTTGNTLPEALACFPVTLARLIGKALSRRARFTMREPDLIPPFQADNDACYLCNPLDLVRFFAAHGCPILQNGAYGRTPLAAYVAGGTWIAARASKNPEQHEQHDAS